MVAPIGFTPSQRTKCALPYASLASSASFASAQNPSLKAEPSKSLTFPRRIIYIQALPAGSVLSAQGPFEAQASAAFVVCGEGRMKVYVYLDGFNLYYRLNGTACKWLNLRHLAKRLLDAGDTVEMVRYFTARVSARSGDPDAPGDSRYISTHFAR
jgi:hypothetical protein